jgi:DNA-binding beta-propeller fold protein YncE
MSAWASFLSVGVLLCAAEANAQVYHVVVVEQGAGRVTVLDGKTGAVRGSVKVGEAPHEVELSGDRRTAYVSNYGLSDKSRAIGKPGDSISVVDLTTFKELRRLNTEPYKAPHGVKLRPGAPKGKEELYVNVEQSDEILVYSAATGKLIRQFAVPIETHNFVFSSDGKQLILMAATSGVVKVDPGTGEILAQYKTEGSVRGLSWIEGEKKLLASEKNGLAILDAGSLSVVRRIGDLGVGQVLYSAMTPDGSYILAPCPLDQKLLVIDTASGKVERALTTGKDPIVVQIAPDGRRAFVSNGADDHLATVDLETFEVRGFGKADKPNGMSFLVLKN